MSIEDELELKAYDMEFCAKRAAESIAALEQNSGWLLSRANQIQGEMAVLREQNKKLKEALKFYANADSYEDFGSRKLSEIDEDGGEWAQKVLEEIEE